MPIIVKSDSVLIELSDQSASTEVALKGATVFSYKTGTGSTERLFTSTSSSTLLSDPAAIRGGIPICWPVFGPPDSTVFDGVYAQLKQHGFARTSVWQFNKDKSGALQEGGAGEQAVFELKSSPDTLKLFDREFILTYTVTLLASSLRVALHVTCSQSASSSSSSSSSSLPFQALLHAYLRLPATVLPAQTHVKGFNSLTFRDKVQGGKEGTEDRDKVPVDGPGGEMDRVYLKTPDVLNVGYQGQRGGMRVSKKGLSDAVLWNPGPSKAAAIADMEQGGHERYICLEPGQVGDFVQLGRGEEWVGEITLEFED